MVRQPRNWTPHVLFCGLVVLGALIFGDYGISWDEPISRNVGFTSLRYVVGVFMPSWAPQALQEFPLLRDAIDRDYGVVFEQTAAALEWTLGIDDSRSAYLLRHAMCFLIFLLGLFAVYRMAAARHGSEYAGLAAAAILLLTPRMFAEAFYNSKDIVFMALFAIAMSSMVAFISRPDIRSAILHALATSLAIDTRLMAVVIPVATVVVFVLKALRQSGPYGRPAALPVYLAATPLLVVLFWPYLWPNPVGNFIEAFANMAHFRWSGTVLFNGATLSTTALPWHYAPGWIGVTVPIPFLLLFAGGLMVAGSRVVRNRLKLWSTEGELQDLIFAGFALTPILAVIALGSVLYDGWRQLYFVYPGMVLTMVTGGVALWNWAQARRASSAFLGITALGAVLFLTVWMVRAHPFQNVYFNALAGSDLRYRFELDYWGLANKGAIERILAADPSPAVYLRADSMTPLTTSMLMLRPADRARVAVLDASHADDLPRPLYAITNYRGVADKSDARYARDYSLFHQQMVDGEIILSVYKWIGQVP